MPYGYRAIRRNCKAARLDSSLRSSPVTLATERPDACYIFNRCGALHPAYPLQSLQSVKEVRTDYGASVCILCVCFFMAVFVVKSLRFRNPLRKGSLRERRVPIKFSLSTGPLTPHGSKSHLVPREATD